MQDKAAWQESCSAGRVHTHSEAGGERWMGQTDKRTSVDCSPLLPWTTFLLSCDMWVELPDSLC